MSNGIAQRSTVSIWTIAMMLLVVSAVMTKPAGAQNPPPAYDITQQCFAVADERDNNGKKDSQDALVRLNRTNGQTTVIGLTGTNNIEAIAFGPLDTLYATDGGQLGTLDLNTGRFTPKPKSIDDVTQGSGIFTDVDGLFFDIGSNILWGVQRVSGKPDLLFQIDPVTGARVAGAFNGHDYVEIQQPRVGGKLLGDLDDIAVDPVDDVIYGAANSGGTGGALVEIDRNTGVTTVIGEFHYPDPYPAHPALRGLVVDDIEGLSFFNDGQLYGSTGNNGPDNNDKNQLYTIDKRTALVTRVGAFPAGHMDYEGLACLTAPAFISLKKLTNGEDATTPPGPFVPPDSTVTWTYILTNTGPITLTDLILIDDKVGQIGPGGVSNCPPANLILNPGDSLTCTATGVAQAGQYVNTAIVTGTRQVDNVFPFRKVAATAASHYFGSGPAIVIKKATNGEDADAPPGPLLPVDSAVTWTYAVTNTGNVPLTSVTVTDDQGVTVTCPTHELAPQATMICTGTGAAQVGQYANLGLVSGLPPAGPLVTASNPSHYFGYRLTGVIGDYVWQDLNLDGMQNTDEPGLEKVTVELWSDGNNDGIPDVQSAQQTSKLDGSYLFTDVTPGRYFVKFLPPAGYLLTMPNQGDEAIDSDPDPLTQFIGPLLVVALQENRTVDAGFIQVGAIGDSVWEDTNGDGDQDTNEAGASGVTVTLWLDSDQNGQPDQQLPPTLQTGNDGHYSFTALDPRRSYYVKFMPTNGRTLTTADVPPDDQRDSDAAQTTGFAGPIRLAFGEVNSTVDAGVLPAGASVSGNVWLGTNPADANTGLVNATVWLKEISGAGVMTTTTSSEGHYAFVELLPKSYRVEVDVGTLPVQVTPLADRDGPPLGVVTVTLTAGQALTNVFFLYQPLLLPAQISGRVWPDNNGNAQPDMPQPDIFDESQGLSEWQVLLKNAQGSLIAERWTSPLGHYTFTNVIPGIYTVEVTPPAEPYRQTFDPDGGLDHKTVITVTSGQTYAPVDFGYQPLSYIAGLVWQGAKEPLPGTALILTAVNGKTTFTTTNPAGKYTFSHLPPERYTVCVNSMTLPPGSKQVADPDPVFDHCHTLELRPKENRENVNFGYQMLWELALSCTINGVAASADLEPSVLTSQTATWEYKVTNKSGRLLANVSIMDPPLTIGQCGPGRVEPNGSIACVAEKSVRVGRQVAFVRAKAWDDANNEVSSPPQPCYYAGYTAGIELTLSINGKKAEPNNGPYIAQTSPITWVHEVRNTGTATLTNLLLSAIDGSGGLPDDGQVCRIDELPPGAVAPCPPVSATAQSGWQTRYAQATGQPVDARGRPLGGRITALAQGDYYGGIPTLVLRPAEAEQPVGLLHVVTASLTLFGQPVAAGLPVHFQVTPQGEAALPSAIQQTDAKGVATFSYRNTDNRQARSDTILAWLNVNPITAAAFNGPAPGDVVDDAAIHWRQLVLTNTDTLSSVPEPIRVVTAYVATKELPEKDGQAVAGLRVGFTAKLGSGELISPVFGTTDDQGRVPFTITTEQVIAPTAASMVTAASLSSAKPAMSAAQPLIGITDLITLWVDINADSGLGVGEPFELVDATTNLPYASFVPQRRGDTVSLAWSTSVANQYAGFNLYRSTAENELGSKLNNNPIGQDENSQFYYSYADILPAKGIYYYWLEAIGYDNRAGKPIGPFLVIWGEDLYLPMIHR